MKIQLFATLDDLVNEYNTGITNTQNELNSLTTEKQTLLDEYNTNYNNQLNQYDSLLQQQKDYIDKATETQKQTQQAQTDYNIGLINQNKAESEKKTNAEIGDAYIDYQKAMNQYGGNAESMASNGLAGTGFAKNTDIAMNITYQNRVSTAKSALMKANTEYDNQIQQALLNNDAALAEIALQQMQQSYQLALQGFEYKNTMYNNKLNYTQTINDDYFNRSQTLQNRIDTYRSDIASINQMQQEYEMEKQQREQEYQQWLAEFNEKQRQFNASLAEEKRQYNTSLSVSGVTFDDSGNAKQAETKTELTEAQYHKQTFGNSEATMKKDDYYFDNGYQPRYLYNKKLNKTGVTAGEVLSAADLKSLNISSSQNIWNLGGVYYVWVPGVRQYKQVDTQTVKDASSWWDRLWHKGI